MLNRTMFFGLCFVFGGMLLGPSTAQGQDFFELEANNGNIHKYDAAGEAPTAARPYFKFEGLTIPQNVFAGTTVNGSVQWTIVNPGGDPNEFLFKNLLANWSLLSPIATIEQFASDASVGTTVTKTFSFQAPSQPNIYSIRLAMNWEPIVNQQFLGIQSFGGDGFFSIDPDNPGVGDYVEVRIVVNPPPECGNGLVEGDEVCDDGNTMDCDTCSDDCMRVITGCGDGSTCGSEACDDGNNLDCDGCRGNCEAVETGCGDGFICGNEACDDGNTDDCDGCRGDCGVVEFGCGDGSTCGNEACDDGNNLDCDGCLGNCGAIEFGCGDGFICGNEVCDDGNTIDCDTCNGDCLSVPSGCGDGAVCDFEVCDDGNTDDCDGCRGNCGAVETGCGDGFICGVETCDDGNTNNGDGCSATCTLADFNYDCVIRSTPSPVDHTASLPNGFGSFIPGATFVVEFWATDANVVNTGIAAAYADLDYPEDLVTCVDLSIVHTPTFEGFVEGICDGSMIDELGGSTTDEGFGVDPEWTRIAYASFIADTGMTGLVEFVLKPSTIESGAHGRGLVSPINIGYGTCSTIIVGTCPCIYDLDDNCFVSGGDLGLFAPCWSIRDTDPLWTTFNCEEKDFDCNGFVSGGDIGWFAGGWNRSCNSFNASFQASQYPFCRICDGPVVCGSSSAARSSELLPVESLRLNTQASPADTSVLLSLNLQGTRDELHTPSLLGQSSMGFVAAGQHVFANVWAKDTSLTTNGLTAVFTDVQYDPSKFAFVSVDSGDTFTLFSEPTTENNQGIVKSVGGATLEASQGAGVWTLVGVVELEALVNISRPHVSLSPSQGEAVSRYGLGLVPDSQVRVVPNRPAKAKRNGVRN